jgi:phytoene dehydrogenase-like protein
MMWLMSTLSAAPATTPRHAGISYKQHPPSGEFDALVIGSGMGGLAAAALLARYAGQRVLVLERHYTAGGFTHVFHRPGYEWDVGVHYIGQVGSPRSMLRKLFDDISGGRLQWSAMPEVYDRIVIQGRTYDFMAGRERFRQQMKQYFPQEAAAIDGYLAEVRAASQASRTYFMEKALPGPVSAVAGPLMRRRFLGYAGRCTGQVLGGLTGNRELIGVLTGQWGDYGLPPAQSSFAMHATVAEHYFEGGFYPVGGASRIAAAIEPVIQSAGGQILVGAEVTNILLDARGRAIGVRMADGRELRAKVILSDAGAWNTYSKLLPGGAPGRERTLQEMAPFQSSWSHACLYVGLRRGSREPEFGGANLWIYPGPDHDANVARFLADPQQPFPAVFISFPSAKDPTFAERYPDRATIEVVTLAPYDWFEKWEDSRWKHRGTGYEALKQNFTERLLRELENHVPAVRGKIDYYELSTPLSTRHFANYQRGEIYGVAGTPERFQARSLRPRTPVRNLYLTGADAAMPGVTGALMGGVLAASVVLRRNVLGAVAKSAPAELSTAAL